MTNDGTMIRSIEEITISARLNMQDMLHKALALGRDFLDAKELLGHGKFLPWLEKLGVSSSTASNYMKVAREIAPGSRLASLPYSKALALLSAPAEEREELAEIADDRSAGEIRKLIEERNRAAAAANAETARADHAEEDAKKYYDEAAALRTTLEARNAEIEEKSLLLCDYLNRISNAKDRLKDAREREEQLKGQLMEAENHRIEVEVAPADYEQLKRDRADLTEAAARAEERAAELEEELEALRAESAGREDAAKTLRVSMTAFMADCGTMPARPETLARSREKIERNLTILESWCEAMREALANAVSIEAVMIE